MTLTIPLSLRLATPKADRHVTRDLHDLQFRTTIPGGYASASFTLSRPLNIQPEEISQFGKVVIYDRRDGQTVWEGRLEDPGRAVGDSGQIWQVTATGPATYAEDRTVSLVYVDRRMDGWRVGAQSIPSVSVDVNDESIQMGLANGVTHNVGYAGLVVYHTVAYTGDELARVSVDWVSTFTSPNFEVWLGTSLGTGATDNHDVQQVNSFSDTLVCSRGGSNAITPGNDTVRLRFVRQTSHFTAIDDSVTLQFFPRVRSILKDINGNDITSGYNDDTVTATQVITDLIGRLLDRYDPDTAEIATTSLDIDQLAYSDGASARRVLDDLMLLEPAYYWAAWETTENGKHRFQWREWPDDVRYDASAVDGFDSPATSGEVYNAVSVRWRDAVGASRVVKATQAVASLDDAGITREAFIDISDEVGSESNATQVANLFLGNHKDPQNQGTLTIARPIMDLYTGRMVQPWEIKPGYLIRVREVLPRIDTLNATERDGITVFKIAAVEFNAGQCASSLELDSYPMTVSHAIAELRKTNIVRKR